TGKPAIIGPRGVEPRASRGRTPRGRSMSMRNLRVLHPLLSAALFTMPAPAACQNTPVSIRAARALDGRGSAIDNVMVTVQGGRITRVERASAGARATYDLKTLTLLPGLID